MVEGTKKGDFGQKERLREIRTKTLLEISHTLGISDTSTHSQIRKIIDERVNEHLHCFPQSSARHQDEVTLMSLNMRGMRGKLTSLDGIDLFSYCRERNVQLLNIQDHNMCESQAHFIQYAAKAGIPDMEHSAITMQHGHIGSRGTNRVGGTAQICGGTLGRYRTKEITDLRGWGRYTGRLIQGRRRPQTEGKRSHKSVPVYQKRTNLAFISVYAAVDSSQCETSMWREQQRKFHNYHSPKDKLGAAGQEIWKHQVAPWLIHMHNCVTICQSQCKN